MRRAFVTFATLFLLWTIVSQLNHSLGTVRIYLWVGGLFITHAALNLPLRSGLGGSLLGGLMLDSVSPVAFGTHTLLFAVGHCLLFNLRDRLPREETSARVVIALFANLALFLVFSFLLIHRGPAPAAVWPRIVFDLICSQVFLALVAPWFFALQARALDFTDLLAHAYERRLQ
jgi:rod shape-determining protein MreD